ncbi:MAG: rhodanese-like domain-containing protein [Nannocystis sp.]|uniref:rhodanese-like domain-containing protein n=1 Tax=Nannocystis sp. TaxID=1962667 RepID=UPI002429E8D0|nr:rhodanese-like domain-containing protein [Nannocystis sp.]MBK9753995.1 rhodanese-like domain-containing protein [Nannocystis sp.]
MQARTLHDQATPNGQGFRDVTPAAVAGLRNTLHIVDVRQPAEFTGELGHIPGAVLVPLATLAAAARAWDPSAEIVLVCRSGGRSSSAAAHLVAAGFSRVMNMTGGMLAYRAQGLPSEP